MDELAAQLATSFQVTAEPNTTAAPHPRFSDYKAKSTGLGDQENRRKAILEIQKKYARVTELKKVLKPIGQHRISHELMLSEWMIEVPEDFEQEYVMVLCPSGKRNLVVASYGETKSYSKGGWEINTFQSRLPGGSRSLPKWQQETTILDCVFNELTKTFYILDMMNWKNYPLYDTETEFRFYWMQDKLSEYPEVGQITKKNKYRFEVLPNFNCSKDNLKNVLASDLKLDLDGLLFFHKRTHYTFGSTPLVTWLKAYMVPEILQVEVPTKYTALKPLTYTNFENHVEQVKVDKIKEEEKKQKQEEKVASKKGRRSKGGSKMDTSIEVTETEEAKSEQKMDSGDSKNT